MKNLHPASIGNALIWGAAIIAAVILLRGSEQAGVVALILGGAAGASVVTVSNALRKEGQQRGHRGQ
jgi:hypothetical protein